MNARLSSVKIYRFFLCIGETKISLILSLVVLTSFQPVLAQKSVWRYVTTIYGGTKSYLNDEMKTLADGNKLVWEKMVTANNSFAIAIAEWDCRNKRRLTREISFYKSDQMIIGTKKKSFEWMEIIPGSTSDFMFTRVCLPPQSPKIAEIITLRANLRTYPDPAAPVAREAKQGDRFEIAPESGAGGWYNIVDSATQQDFWLHGNTIKILDSSPIQKKTRKKDTRSKNIN